MLRPVGGGGHHAGHGPRPGLGSVSMFRPVRPPSLTPQTTMSPEERAMMLARSQLLRGGAPMTPPFPGMRPSLTQPGATPPPLPTPGLQHLWSQWAQLQQLSSALHAANVPSPAAALFSNLLNQAQQRFSPYVISPPSPPHTDRKSPASTESRSSTPNIGV